MTIHEAIDILKELKEKVTDGIRDNRNYQLRNRYCIRRITF